MSVTPELFGRMSLGYYVLLCRELEALDIRHYYPSAAIQAVIVNMNRDPRKSDPVEPWDFMPGWEKTEAQLKAEREAAEDAFLMQLDVVIAGAKERENVRR